MGSRYNQDGGMAAVAGAGGLLILLMLTLALLGGLIFWSSFVSAEPENPETYRRLHSGWVEGTRAKNDALAWLGIPYAQAPIGKHRWRAPQPTPNGSLHTQHKQPKPECRQYNPYRTAKTLIGDEDCLYLNIWSPTPSPNSSTRAGDENGLPVMVWIHGGSNVLGDGSHYDGSLLATEQDVIVVTLNYRLGVFGWFYHPALADSRSPANSSGNYALLDIIEALRWVRRNIAAFGGDPERVTVFGESAGASNIYGLLVSPLSEGLFHRAILQSGSPNSLSLAQASHWVDDCEAGLANSANEVLLQLLIQQHPTLSRKEAKQRLIQMGPDKQAKLLRSQPLEAFTLAYQTIAAQQTENQTGYSFLPQLFEDGYVIPKGGIRLALQEGRFHSMPIMIGSTRDEFSLLLAHSPLFGKPIKQPYYSLASEYLSKMLKAHSVDEPANMISNKQHAGVFVYRFDWDHLSPAPWLKGVTPGATHGLDVPFVFGHRNLGPEFTQLPLIMPTALDSFQSLSKSMIAYWAQFAATGNPKQGRFGQQPAWTAWPADARPQNCVYQ